MQRRTVIAAGSSVLVSVGLAGCQFLGLGPDTSEFKLEAESVTESDICEQATERLEVLEAPEEDAAKRVIAGEDSAIVDFTGRKELYLEGQDRYHHVEIRHRDSADDYQLSLVASVDTQEAICEIVLDDLVAEIDQSTTNQTVREVLRQTAANGQFEATPINESAAETYRFVSGLTVDRGFHPIYIRIDSEYYELDYQYDSGE
ncbi:hypothetical protein [Haloarchaeobius baliensis]|uniref:hypothetical protein n=1 Tax=Haloarchaeobius baliensis TaxID=1670458 RepID=UPI003F882170